MKTKLDKKYVIVNADDFGLCVATNRAIITAHTKGILTSTSLLVTCEGFSDAVRKIKKHSSLGIGLHLSLTLGKPVLKAEKIRNLIDKNDLFYGSFTRLLFISKKQTLQQIENEFCAQIEKALQAKLPIDHLNSQAHVHMIPQIFPIVISLAKKYNISCVRLSKDQFLWTKNIKQNLFPIVNNNLTKLFLLNILSKFNSSHINTHLVPFTFYGVYHTGFMSSDVLESIFKNVKPGISEVLSHPGYTIRDSGFDYKVQRMHSFMISPFRLKELEALTDPALREIIKQEKIILTTFKKISKL